MPSKNHNRNKISNRPCLTSCLTLFDFQISKWKLPRVPSSSCWLYIKVFLVLSYAEHLVTLLNAHKYTVFCCVCVCVVVVSKLRPWSVTSATLREMISAPPPPLRPVPAVWPRVVPSYWQAQVSTPPPPPPNMTPCNLLSAKSILEVWRKTRMAKCVYNDLNWILYYN